MCGLSVPLGHGGRIFTGVFHFFILFVVTAYSRDVRVSRSTGTVRVFGFGFLFDVFELYGYTTHLHGVRGHRRLEV